MTKAERQRLHQRAYRARCRRGVSMVRVAVPPEVVEALIAARRVDDAGSRDAARVGAELAAVLRQWAEIWRRK